MQQTVLAASAGQKGQQSTCVLLLHVIVYSWMLSNHGQHLSAASRFWL